MSWEDYQVELIDPAFQPCGSSRAPAPPYCSQPWQKIVANIGNASNRRVSNSSLTGRRPKIFHDWRQRTVAGCDPGTEDVFEIPCRFRPAHVCRCRPSSRGRCTPSTTGTVDWFGANNAWLSLQWSYTGDMLNQVETTGSWMKGRRSADQAAVL